MPLKIDLHVHTNYSYDGFTKIDEAIARAKHRGLNGIAITDHDTIEGALNALEMKTDIIIIPGIEISTEKGHIIALGVIKQIPPRLTLLETVTEIRKQCGIVVVPHPYEFFYHGIGPRETRFIKPEAIEVINSSSPILSLTKNLNQKLAESLNAAKVAGSDSHIPETIGNAYTTMRTNSTRLEGIIQAIENGETIPAGAKTALSHRLRKIKLQVKRKIRF